MAVEVLRRPPLLVAPLLLVTPYSFGRGMCVSLKHGLVIVSVHSTMQLHVYSLVDGAFVRSIGGPGTGKGQFGFSSQSGLCICPDADSVLVPEFDNLRVQQIRIVGAEDTSRCIRFFGNVGHILLPECVDCNEDVVVVLEWTHRICVLSWQTGSVLSTFGRKGSGPGELLVPRGLRLLSHNRLVVADTANRRLCVFGTRGEFVRAVPNSLGMPLDVLGCRTGFVVARNYPNSVDVMSSSGKIVSVLGGCGKGVLAALPDGGFVVGERHQFRVFAGLDLRVAWLRACCTSHDVAT